MLYETSKDWVNAPHKNVLFFGMSGLGKTYLSKLLRANGDWFHYSIDYRIGTRYMGEYIADDFKAKAMEVPFLRELLLSDSIKISSKIRFDNLTPLSTYLGKPGDPQKGGLKIGEYQRRQTQFRAAEIAALMDTGQFIDRAQKIYGYPNFICDTGGSICEWIDQDLGANDPLISELRKTCLMVWLKGGEAHTQALIERFDRAPKPMAYHPAFLIQKWHEYLNEFNYLAGDIDPDNFIRWTYAQALAHRQPLYEHMAKYSIILDNKDVSSIHTTQEFNEAIAQAIDARSSSTI